MKPYKRTGGDSGVVAYDCGPTWIKVKFKSGETYTYAAQEVGRSHVAQMKRLADAGSGLTTYINTHPEVKEGYSV